MKQALLNFPQQRRFRVALGVFFFISGIRFATWACRIPDIQNMLHLNNAGLGTVLLALPIGSLAGLPAAGYLVTKYGSRKMLLLSALTLPVPMIGIGLSVHSYLLAVNLFLFGLTGNLLNISVNTQAVAIEKMYGRSIMASFHGLWSLGGFSGAALGTLMMTMHVAPLIHFCIVSGLSLAGMFLFYKHTVEDKTHQKKVAKAFNKPDTYLMVLGVIAFSSMVCEGTMFDWSGVYFDKVINVKEGLITLGFVAFMFAMASGRFLGDGFITRLGTTKVLRGSGIVIFMGLITAVLFPHIATATIGFILVGMGVSSVVPIAYAMAGSSKTLPPGAAIAAVSSIGFLGFLLGPPLIGFIAQASNLRWSFTIIALLGLVMVAISGKLKEK